MLFRLLKVDLKGRAFVFLHANGCAAIVGIEMERAIQSIGGNDEGTAESAIFIGGEIGRTDFLPVGVLEGNLLVVIADKAQILTLAARRNSLEINGLSRAINGAVGEQSGRILLPVVLVRFPEIESTFGQQHIIVFAEIDEKRSAVIHFIVQDGFAVLVGLHRCQNDGLVLASLVVPFAAVTLQGDTIFSFPRFAVHGHYGHFVFFCIGDIAQIRYLEIEHQHLVLVLVILADIAHKEIETSLQSRQGNQSAVLAVVGFGGKRKFLFCNSLFGIQHLDKVLFKVNTLQINKFFLTDFHYLNIRCGHILVFQHGGDGLVGQLHLIQFEVDLWLFDALDEALAVLRTLRFRELRDSLLTQGFGLREAVEIGAVLAVALVLINHVAGNQRGDFSGERIALMLRLQLFHRDLVLLVLMQDGIDEAKTLEVVVNQHILVVILQVKANQLLVDFQAFVERVVICAKVNFYELFGGQPPVFGVAFHVVSVGLCLVVVGHTVEHELKQRSLIFNVIFVVVLVLIQSHKILSLSLFQSLDGFQSLSIMLIDARFETFLVPIFHLHLGNVAVDGQVLVDAPFIVVQVVGIGSRDFFVQKRVANLVQLPDSPFSILDEVLVGVFLNGEPEDVLPIKVGLQQLHLVLVLRCLLLDGIQLFFSRFRQVFLKVFLYFFPHGFVVVFRGFWCVRVLVRCCKSQQTNGH